MRLRYRSLGLGLGFVLACGQASAQDAAQVAIGRWHAAPQVVPTPYCPQVPQAMPQPTQPGAEKPAPPPGSPGAPAAAEMQTPPDVNFDAPRAGAGRDESFALATPNMMGDFAGYCARRAIMVHSTQTFTTVTIPPPSSPPSVPLLPITTVHTIPSTECVVVCDPVLGRAGSGFKIADNDSPRPQDRVFFTYNYFDGLAGAGGFNPTTNIALSNTNNSQTTVTLPAIAAAGRNVNLHRELLGFEKTFLGGDASVELRLPFFQTTGDGSVGGDDFGDLTAVLKYAVINNCTTGNCLSLGLAVTAPTGPGIDTIDGTIHDVLLQPFIGGIWNAGDFFVQGFTSLVVPTDARDVTVLFNDLGVGYTVYRGCRDGMISFVAPFVEVHVTTGLNHQNISAPITVGDIVSLTPGAYIGLGERTVLSIGVAIPLSGSEPYNVEGIAQLNFRF